jgi:hypothetical protein
LPCHLPQASGVFFFCFFVSRDAAQRQTHLYTLLSVWPMQAGLVTVTCGPLVPF